MKYNEFSNTDQAEWLEDGVSLEHIGPVRDTASPCEEVEDTVFGNPERDTAYGERAEDEYRAGMFAEKLAIEQLRERDLSEKELERVIASCPLCSDAFGASLSDVGRISEAFGLSVEQCDHLELNDLAELLEEENQRLLCPVSGVCLDLDGMPFLSDGVPDRLIEVIGIEWKEREPTKVFINDPYRDGHEVASEVFLRAWGTEDRIGFVIGG